jgi:hypothetical protein
MIRIRTGFTAQQGKLKGNVPKGICGGCPGSGIVAFGAFGAFGAYGAFGASEASEVPEEAGLGCPSPATRTCTQAHQTMLVMND